MRSRPFLLKGVALLEEGCGQALSFAYLKADKPPRRLPPPSEAPKDRTPETVE